MRRDKEKIKSLVKKLGITLAAMLLLFILHLVSY